ncbi:MAG: metal-dependent transcriptional regulator [Planctomycetota bacterium]|jgi:DtxR family Mn-dependent transcriptional regulator
MLSASIEDYIKAIYALESANQPATTKRIAQRVRVKMASVTGMIKHLAAEGYVRHTPYRGAQLTERGRKVAVGLIRRHRLIELFLADTLGVAWDEVDADAEVLEHAVSDRLIERIYEYLGRPEFDPHGSPIPSKDGAFPDQPGVTLDQLPEGSKGHVAWVSDSDPEFLRYLTRLKLEIGTPIVVQERAPFSGPITLKAGRASVVIGREAAHRIRINTEAKPPTRRASKKTARR